MNTAKVLIAWLVLFAASAGATILAVQMAEKPLGLRPMIVTFGQPKDTH
ncbi:MAG TPA: hypothetical protein VMH81_05345 [Bryobacteraceae bacterium]|nr:hypothetical protein [Bryobacteraceae bacterium]